MREIRAKTTKKENREHAFNNVWVEGDLVVSRDKYYIHPRANAFQVNNELSKLIVLHEVIPETIGQYTGLTDKNGKKIFEGDIVKQETTSEFFKVSPFQWKRYGVVRFGYYDWNKGETGYSSIGWYIEPLKSISIIPKNYLIRNIKPGLNQCDINDNYHPIEVIGNIYDNPELLEIE